MLRKLRQIQPEGGGFLEATPLTSFVAMALLPLVAELVAGGGAVHAVVPAHHTLEERFLSLLGAAPGAAQDAAPSENPEARP